MCWNYGASACLYKGTLYADMLLLVCVLQERVKELNDKFNSELEADRQKFDMLLQEKNEQEVEYEEKLRQVCARFEACMAMLLFAGG
jgi:hypothetical protein